MKRKVVWGLVGVLLLVGGCGGTGGGPSGSDGVFVFVNRGSLILILCGPAACNPAVCGSDVCNNVAPQKITLIAILRDPNGIPVPGATITFAAEFPDATFVPGQDNFGAKLTDVAGQAIIDLFAGLTTGRMQVIAEAPRNFNIASAITLDITAQGFISLGPLGIIPVEVTFINPRVGPGTPECPDTPEENPEDAIFNAVGGTPPYRWDNSNKDLGRVCPTGLPNVNETAEYTLIGPIPTEQTGALTDTITLLDAAAGQANATVTVIFADCTLMADGTQVTLTGTAGNNFRVDVSDGVPPFAVTQQFPGSVDVVVSVIDENGDIIPGETCDAPEERCVIDFTLPEMFLVVEPGTILIRDARGCTAQIQLTVKLCGNGAIDAGEQCDPLAMPTGCDVMNDETCVAAGQAGECTCVTMPAS